MKSSKSLALLLLTLAGNSIYAASSSSSSNSAPTSKWFNIALPSTPNLIHHVEPSWTDRLKGFARPTVVSATLLGVGYLAAKNNNYRPEILAATSSSALLCGWITTVYGFTNQKKMPHTPKTQQTIQSDLQQCTASITNLNRNDTYAANKLIPHIEKQTLLKDFIQNNLSNSLARISRPQDPYDQPRYEQQTLPIKAAFIKKLQEEHSQVFSYAQNNVSTEAVNASNRNLARYASTCLSQATENAEHTGKMQGLTVGGIITTVASAAALIWTWFTTR